MTHDPRLVDELIAKVDAYLAPRGGNRELLDLDKAYKALRPAPPKPREWWVNVYKTHGEYTDCLHRSKEDAGLGLMINGETVHVREVMPNEIEPIDKPKVWLPEFSAINGGTDIVIFKDSFGNNVKVHRNEYNAIRNKLMGLKP